MKDALSHFPFVELIGAGLILFMSIFALIIFWTYRNGSEYDRLSQLPIEGGNHDFQR